MTIDIAEGGRRLPVAERAILPGAPGSPFHPFGRRVAYGIVGLVVGLTGGLGNALVTANLVQLQGALGLYSYEMNWLPTVYAMTFVCSSLILIKLRIAFGVRPFALVFTGLYAVTTLAHLLVGGFAMAVLVRAASGVCAAALNTLTIYFVMQAASPSWRIKSIALALGIPQLATPLARLFSTELLGLGEWRALYCFEFGLALIAFVAVLVLPLPPSEKQRTFDRLDFVTFPLLAIGFALLCAVLGMGRVAWWTDMAWLGQALVIGLPLIVAALLIEHHRSRPLLVTRWLASADIVRFIVVSIMFRIASAEQTTGVVGLLNVLGLNNDQFHGLFTIVLVATALGSVASAVLITPQRTNGPMMLAIGLAALASFMDYGATNLVRPEQFYVTQAVIAFSATMFLGPSLLFGLGNALSKGPSHIISFIGLFGLIQTVGGLAGSALIGTFEIIREKYYSSLLVAQLTVTDPLVAGRLQAGGSLFADTVADPVLRSAQGVALLGRQATIEAHVLAYNDVFLLTGFLATGTTLYLALVLVWSRLSARRAAYTHV